MNINHQIYPGTIFYKGEYAENGNINYTYYHLAKIYNESTYGLVKFGNQDIVKMTIPQINEAGIKAKLPDAFMVISVVKCKRPSAKIEGRAQVNEYTTDIVSQLYLMSDLSKEPDEKEKKYNMRIPKGGICRQMCNDVFYQIVDQNKVYLGCCASEESCPSGVEYTDLMACDFIDESNQAVVAVYREDTLDDILSRIPAKKKAEYDQILMGNFIETAKNKAADLGGSLVVYDSIIKEDCYLGMCKTYRQLLEVNNFMFTVQASLRVTPVNLDLGNVRHMEFKDQEVLDNFSRILTKNVVNAHAIKYQHHMVLSGNYFYLMDKRDNLYVVLFEDAGEYTIPVEELGYDEENLRKLATYMPSSSVMKAYDFIRSQNTDKYKK